MNPAKCATKVIKYGEMKKKCNSI